MYLNHKSPDITYCLAMADRQDKHDFQDYSFILSC